jgi:hypothetical protein
MSPKTTAASWTLDPVDSDDGESMQVCQWHTVTFRLDDVLVYARQYNVR